MTERLYERRGRVALIQLDNPPVNGLSYLLRRHLLAAVNAAAADATVAALVIHGSGETFCGGADINELDSPLAAREPNLPSLVALLEDCSKPTVAAIAGLCLGGGVELALGCHFRIAQSKARIGLPEIHLGLIPGAGGTQRLPRAIGVERALNLILSGRPVAAASLADSVLFDLVVEDDVLAVAVAYAGGVAAEGRPRKRLGEREIDATGLDFFFQFAHENVRSGPEPRQARRAAVEAVEAAVKHGLAEGLAREQRLFWNLLATPESAALRHAFMAERNCGKIPALAGIAAPAPVERAGVVGAGTMGSGIALCFLNAGLPVTLVEADGEALERGRGLIRQAWEAQVKKGRLTPEQMAELEARLTVAMDYAALANADLIVEAVFEDMGVKEAVFKRLDQVARPDAILASNTSTLDLNRIAAFTGRPGQVLGLHFFSPAPVMKLLEVVRGDATAPEVLAAALALARRIGKTAVLSGVCDGFIGNRMLNEYLRMAAFLVDEGATPWQVDAALEAWGMAMGPFRMSDMAGNDIGWAIRKRMYVERPKLRFSALPDRLCEAGRFGQKRGAGWYRYPPGERRGLPDVEVDVMIAEYRARLGIAPRVIGASEIVERCIYALVNEGARILQEGIALRASDIDVTYLCGYGFPRHRGGPMQYADEIGLYRVARRMEQFSALPGGDREFWQPAALLAHLAASDGGFAAHDAQGARQ